MRDLIGYILRRWGHGPSYTLCTVTRGRPPRPRAPGPPVRGVEGSTTRWEAPAPSRCRVPVHFGRVGTRPRRPGSPLGFVVLLANIARLCSHPTGYQPKPATPREQVLWRSLLSGLHRLLESKRTPNKSGGRQAPPCSYWCNGWLRLNEQSARQCTGPIWACRV